MSAISKYHRAISVLIAALSLGTAIYYNEANLSDLLRYKPKDHKVEPRYHWLETPDDAAYLRPAENYYHHHIWRDNNPGRQSYFVRTPGYALFRYALMHVMGYDKSYYYFRYIQALAFAFSVLLLYRIALMAGLSRGYALGIEAVYGLSPFAIGFLYYSITEGITPALMILYVYCLLSGQRSFLAGTGHDLSLQEKGKPFFFLLAAIVMSYIGITRPVLLLFSIALPFTIWWSLPALALWRRMVFILLNCLIILSPISIWAYRSYEIAGQNVGIYPIYYVENNSQFRPTHEAIWRFEKSYGTEGRDFHDVMVPLWRATIKGDTSAIYIDSLMTVCPTFVRETVGEQKLRATYELYRQSIIYQRTLYPRGTVMPDTIPAIEREVIRQFDAYTAQINSSHWLWCHIAVPVKLFKALSFHSNLSMYMFQHTLRGLWWVETLRYICLMLHMLCCLSFIYIVFFARDQVVRLLMGFIIGGYFFYLCYFFRGLEERYTLPILPLMLIGLLHCLYDLKNRFAPQKL